MLHHSVKRIYSVCLTAVLVISVMGGCQSQDPLKMTTASGIPGATPGGSATAQVSSSDDVWHEEGWTEAVWAIPGWDKKPYLTDEYRFRQTDPSVQRELAGNMYTTGWPLVEETETLTLFGRQDSLIIDITKDHWLMDKLEEQTNVKIEWQLAPSEGFAEKRNLVLAGGDLPDAFIGGGFSKNEELIFGEQQGLLVPINDYIEQYGYYTKKVLDELNTDVKAYITTPSGKIYTLPSVAANYHVSMAHKMWINTAWLKAVGLEKPTTTDEFAAVLRAFKTEDPNGNGLQDELPLVGSPSGWNSSIDDFLVNAFLLHPTDYKVVDNGKMNLSIAKEEYKQAMIWLNGLFDEGLIDKDSFIRDAAQLQQLAQNPDYDIIGCFPNGTYGVANIDHTNPRSAVWEPLAPLIGPEGVQVTYFDPFGSLNPGTFAVTKDCANPALAVRWIDFFYAPCSWAGPYDVDWTYAKVGEMNLFNDKQAVVTDLRQSFWEANNVWVEPMWFPYMYSSFEERAMISSSSPNGYDSLMYAWTKEYYEPYKNTAYVPAQMYIPLEAVNDYNQCVTDIAKYAKEKAAQFITGEIDVEAYWPEYLATLKQLGIDTVNEQNQIAYDAYRKNID